MTPDQLKQAAEPIAVAIAQNCGVAPQLVFPHLYLGLQDLFAAKAPAAPTQAEPMFWVRLLRDGMYEGPVHHKSVGGKMMRDEKPDEWHPLYTAPPAPTEQQIGALQAELAGNEAATMHLSRMVDELRALLCQAMRVMKDLHESATPDESREDCPPIIPTSDFAKFVNDNAALMYAIKQCGHDAAPPQGAAKEE